jgi:hypothetical protein
MRERVAAGGARTSVVALTERAVKLAFRANAELASNAKAQRIGRSFLFEHKRAFFADRAGEPLCDLGEQPRQGYFEPHVIVGDVDQPRGALAHGPDVEGKTVSGPGFLVDREERGVMRAHSCEAGLDLARCLLSAELVRNGYDEGLRHGTFPD